MKEKGFVLKDFIVFVVVPLIIIGFVAYFWINNNETIDEVQCRDVAKSVKKAAELYYDETILDVTRYTTTNFDLSRDELLFEIVGAKPEAGNVIITTDGDIAIASYFNGYCALKDYKEDTFKIVKMEVTECSIE